MKKINKDTWNKQNKVIFTGSGWYFAEKYPDGSRHWVNLGGVKERIPVGLGCKLIWIEK